MSYDVSMRKILKVNNSIIHRAFVGAKHSSKIVKLLLKKNKSPQQLIETLVGKNPESLLSDFKNYKGGLIKAAQLISSYGEYFLSEELQKPLRTFTSQTSYLDFKDLKINTESLKEINITPTPFASASIGQVHLAHCPKRGEMALKIMFPSIKQTIKIDLLFINTFINLISKSGVTPDLSQLKDEIKINLLEELDYKLEAQKQKKYRNQLKLKGVKVPHVYDEISTDQYIFTQYVQGMTIDELSRSSNQKLKLEISKKIIQLYFEEIFVIGLVQTDAHIGNYLIDTRDQNLCVIDFGSVKQVPEDTLQCYQALLKAMLKLDKSLYFDVLYSFLKEKGINPWFHEHELWSLVTLTNQALMNEKLNWSTTTLPDQIFEKGKEIFQNTPKSLIVPPDFLFLDRKLIGTFSILRSLGQSFDISSLIEPYIK